MATFRKATFNASSYASFRPTYPRQLFDFVFQYHERSPGARWDTAVDLGCGTGQATVELTPTFKRVIGVDPSAGMLSSARQYVHERYSKLVGEGDNPPSGSEYEFVQSTAEDLSFIPDGSVDLIVAAQAAHWFDWSKLWPECARVLRKQGSAAFWIYSEFRLTHYPALSPLIKAYAQGMDPTTSVGPHWQQPGRSILDNHLLDVPDASSIVPGTTFTHWERVFFTGDHHPSLPQPHRPILLSKTLTWSGLLSYFYTWSSLHTFHECHPHDRAHPNGDLAVRFLRTLKEGVARIDHAAQRGAGAGDGDDNEAGQIPRDEDEVEVEWPVAMILVKRGIPSNIIEFKERRNNELAKRNARIQDMTFIFTTRPPHRLQLYSELHVRATLQQHTRNHSRQTTTA